MFNSSINIYTGKVRGNQKRVQHLLKLTFCVWRSGYEAHLFVVHTAELARLLLSRGRGFQMDLDHHV